MKTGIIIYSRTGHTQLVAEKIKDALITQGGTVVIEHVTAANDGANSREAIQLQDIPDISDYDVILIGSPVHGFSIAPVMKSYLQQLPSIDGKKVGCFVTQHFPKPWMGGKRTVAQMCQLCHDKGAEVSGTSIVNWTSKARETLINDTVAVLSGLVPQG